MPFILKKYSVSVAHYGAATFYAKNKNSARMKAFNSLVGATGNMSFKRFLQVCGPIEQRSTPPDFGKPIMVADKPAYWVEHAGGNSVAFVRPDSDVILYSHELDVQPMPATEAGVA